MLLVDLSDMGDFISAVQNRFVFTTCVSRCELKLNHQQLGQARAWATWAGLEMQGIPRNGRAPLANSEFGTPRHGQTLRIPFSKSPNCWYGVSCPMLAADLATPRRVRVEMTGGLVVLQLAIVEPVLFEVHHPTSNHVVK